MSGRLLPAIDTPYTTIVVDRLPRPEELTGSGWILGTVSVSHPGLRRRFALASHTFRFGDVLLTSRDIARWWVKTYYDLERLRRRRLPAHHTWAPVPLLARRGRYQQAWYVDIRGLHREIISRVGYDVEYALGEYLTLNPIAVLLPKACYVSLSSLSISPQLTLRKWIDQRIVTVNAYNRFANTSLYALIRDVQLAIACDVVDACSDEIVYYNTDGCIVTTAHAVDSVCDVVAEWGMTARIKREGSVIVAGTGSYAWGDDRVRLREARARLEGMMDIRLRDWLRERFQVALTIQQRETIDMSDLLSEDQREVDIVVCEVGGR